MCLLSSAHAKRIVFPGVSWLTTDEFGIFQVFALQRSLGDARRRPDRRPVASAIARSVLELRVKCLMSINAHRRREITINRVLSGESAAA